MGFLCFRRLLENIAKYNNDDESETYPAEMLTQSSVMHQWLLRIVPNASLFTPFGR